MAIVFPSQKGSALTCAELENNFREFIKRVNHTGFQSSSTISDLYDTVKLYDFIVDLQTCCTTLTNDLNQLQDDLFGQGELADLIANLQAQIQSIITNLNNAISNSQSILDLQQCCTTNTNAITNLQGSIQSLLDGLADLNALLALKANRASPILTGIPLTPQPLNNAPDGQIPTVKYIKDFVAEITDTTDALTATLLLKANTSALNTIRDDIYFVLGTKVDDATFNTFRNNLNDTLDLKANRNSPNFLGTPLVPTPATNAGNGQITNVGYVKGLINTINAAIDTLGDRITGLSGLLNAKANIASPSFTGIPLSITPLSNAPNSQITTVEYVKNYVDQEIAGIGNNLNIISGVVTYHVNDTTGNDTTGTGAVDAPFKSPQRALDFLRTQVGNLNTLIRIKLANGTYPGFSIDNINANLIIEGNTINPEAVQIDFLFDTSLFIDQRYYLSTAIKVDSVGNCLITGLSIKLGCTGPWPTNKYTYLQIGIWGINTLLDIRRVNFFPSLWNPALPSFNIQTDGAPTNGTREVNSIGVAITEGRLNIGDRIIFKSKNGFDGSWKHAFSSFGYSTIDTAMKDEAEIIFVSGDDGFPAFYSIFNMGPNSSINNGPSSTTRYDIMIQGNVSVQTANAPNISFTYNQLTNINWPAEFWPSPNFSTRTLRANVVGDVGYRYFNTNNDIAGTGPDNNEYEV